MTKYKVTQCAQSVAHNVVMRAVKGDGDGKGDADSDGQSE